MKSSCISHPDRQPLLIIRAWQIVACGGNVCAAALLSFFEYWHNVKLGQFDQSQKINEMAERHGENRFADESTLQYHNQKALHKGMLGIYGRDSIRDAIQLLEALDFISVHASPYAWDRTGHYHFHSNAVNDWLAKNSDQVIDLFDDRFSDDAKTAKPRSKRINPHIDNLIPEDRAFENPQSLTKITHQITTTTTPSFDGLGDDCIKKKIDWLIQKLNINVTYCKSKLAGLPIEIQCDLLCELLAKKGKPNSIKASAESYLAGLVRKAKENKFELTDGWQLKSRLDALLEKFAEVNSEKKSESETERSVAPPDFFENAKKILTAERS